MTFREQLLESIDIAIRSMNVLVLQVHTMEGYSDGMHDWMERDMKRDIAKLKKLKSKVKDRKRI